MDIDRLKKLTLQYESCTLNGRTVKYIGRMGIFNIWIVECTVKISPSYTGIIEKTLRLQDVFDNRFNSRKSIGDSLLKPFESWEIIITRKEEKFKITDRLAWAPM